MTALCYVLAGIAAAAIAFAASQAIWLRTANAAAMALLQVNMQTARDRDAEKARADAAEIELKNTQVRLATTEAQRNAAVQQGADDVAERVKSGTVADAQAAVERLSGVFGSGLVPPVSVPSPSSVPDHPVAAADGDDLEKPV